MLAWVLVAGSLWHSYTPSAQISNVTLHAHQQLYDRMLCRRQQSWSGLRIGMTAEAKMYAICLSCSMAAVWMVAMASQSWLQLNSADWVRWLAGFRILHCLSQAATFFHLAVVFCTARLLGVRWVKQCQNISAWRWCSIGRQVLMPLLQTQFLLSACCTSCKLFPIMVCDDFGHEGTVWHIVLHKFLVKLPQA